VEAVWRLINNIQAVNLPSVIYDMQLAALERTFYMDMPRIQVSAANLRLRALASL
jgi:hypothetical protein